MCTCKGSTDARDGGLHPRMYLKKKKKAHTTTQIQYDMALYEINSWGKKRKNKK